MTNSDNAHLTVDGAKPSEIETNRNPNPLLIGICGGSASGKTTIASTILANLKNSAVILLGMDSFYKVLNEQESKLANRNEYNFDCPEAFDFDILLTTLQQLKEGRKIQVPIYNFATHSREEEMETMNPAQIVIFEGILTFHDPHIRDMLDVKIFIDADDDIRLARRLNRDIADRGRKLEGVIKQYTTMVQPSYNQYIAPLKKYADIIIPRGGENSGVAILHIVHYVRGQFNLREGCDNEKCLYKE